VVAFLRFFEAPVGYVSSPLVARWAVRTCLKHGPVAGKPVETGWGGAFSQIELRREGKLCYFRFVMVV